MLVQRESQDANEGGGFEEMVRGNQPLQSVGSEGTIRENNMNRENTA